jgi:phospholipid/cholesterol/gamma-HCH transport system ATP-binding protein
MIEIVDLRKSFHGQAVLNGINLRIEDKELLAIIGKSGGGKSVLLKHLIGLLKPDSGSISIDGKDITRVSRAELDRIREKLGVLFQGGALFDSSTVYDNVAFPLREKTKLREKEIRERVRQALHDVGLTDTEQKFPAEISGGMRKRVALARALITEPAIVLFDEPTTGLDPIMLNAIHDLIRTTHAKYKFTGVIVSHEIPEIFSVADRIAVLYEGRIVETGTSKDIKASENEVVKQFISGGKEGPIGEMG